MVAVENLIQQTKRMQRKIQQKILTFASIKDQDKQDTPAITKEEKVAAKGKMNIEEEDKVCRRNPNHSNCQLMAGACHEEKKGEFMEVQQKNLQILEATLEQQIKGA